MPYIPEDKRLELAQSPICPRNVGELNYMFTMSLQMYLDKHGESYQTHNDIMGVLSSVTKEWYRRKVAPYEDKKIKENGDVF